MNLLSAPRVVNIFAIADYHQEIDLDNLSLDDEWVVDCRKAGNSLMLRFSFSPVLLRVLKSGKVRMTGGRTDRDIDSSLSGLSKILQKSNILTVAPTVKVLNRVATVDLRVPVDLDRLARANPVTVGYEPEQFPGAIVQLESGGTGLLFASGKMVITGLKTEADILHAANEIKRFLENGPYEKRVRPE